MTFRALLIGADGYFPNKLSNGGSYPPLGGCANDVRRVEAMLRGRIDAPVVTTLVAPANVATTGGDDPVWPTAKNIRRAFEDLAASTQRGDQVFLFYSGHGGRVKTAWKDIKGAGGDDEALVPIDIGRPDDPDDPPYTRPERYIRDVELAHFLERLAELGAITTVVFDSCHSGGATRGIGDLAVRTAVPPGVDDRPYVGDPQIAARVAELFRSAARDAAQPSASWLPPARGYVFLAACRDVDAALECAIDGKPRTGLLTDALLETLAALAGRHSWSTVFHRVLAGVLRRAPAQMPQLLGDVDRIVFEAALQPVPPTFFVRAVDREQRTVELDGGLAHGITSGTRIEIFAPGERRTDPLARATVSTADSFCSTALLESDADPAGIPGGAPAVASAASLARRVLLVGQDGALTQVRDALAAHGGGFLVECRTGETPDYQVALAGGSFSLADMTGAPFEHLAPIPADRDEAGRTVVETLRRIWRFHTIRALAAPADALTDQLGVEILTAADDWSPRTPVPLVGGNPLVAVDGTYHVASGTWLWFRLTNRRASAPLNFALLNLARTWEVQIAAPRDAGRRYETIGGTLRAFAFRMTSPIAETIDIVKLVIATGDVNLRALGTADVPRGLGDDPLARVLDVINAKGYSSRSLPAPLGAPPTWATREFRIRTYQT